jgi:polyhydroxyalkanoate synthesis regulator phasin
MNEYTLTLINGTFSMEESQKILMDVVASKIKFHEKKKLSALIKDHRVDVYSEQRIEELRKNMDELNKQLATIQEDTALEIYCEIHIKPKHP